MQSEPVVASGSNGLSFSMSSLNLVRSYAVWSFGGGSACSSVAVGCRLVRLLRKLVPHSGQSSTIDEASIWASVSLRTEPQFEHKYWDRGPNRCMTSHVGLCFLLSRETPSGDSPLPS